MTGYRGIVGFFAFALSTGVAVAQDRGREIESRLGVVQDAEPPVDVLRLRLLRNETRRWQLEAKTRSAAPERPRDDAEEGAGKPEPESIIPAEDSFDDWAFGGEDGARRFRDQLDKLLVSKILEVEQVFRLTHAQRQKLMLAGRGDLLRLLDVVEDARSEFQRARWDIDRLTELRKDLGFVDLRVTEGPFEMGSLFSKTLRKMLDEKQLVRRPTSGAR
jgi:hypothetical protein